MSNNDNFRFPSRPVKIIETPPPEEGDNDESGRGEGEINLVPNWIQNALPNTSAWKYEPSKKYVFNSALQKKISLENLNTSDKILKIVAVFENIPEMDSSSFIIALQQASYQIYSMPVSRLITEHINGEKITWGMNIENNENKVEEPTPLNPDHKHKNNFK